jgi:hypothetical protein
MGTIIRRLAVALIAAATSGCAGLDVYQTPDLSGTQSGIKFYTAKPYVLVARSAADKPFEVKVVYLPDLANPLYAKPRTGIGMAKYTLAFNDGGMLTSFNQETDAKLPELVGNLATLVKAFDFGRTTETNATFELYEVMVADGKTTLKKVELKP